MTRHTWRVVKVGGSLFDEPRLPKLLHDWLAIQAPRPSVLVAGGGAWVELVRDTAQRHALEESACHWVCIDLMSVTAQLLSTMTGLPIVRDWRALEIGGAAPQILATAIILDCGDFLRTAEPQCAGRVLPANWSTTSDSIAARVAGVIGAEELVLLKSALPPRGATRESCAGDYVDRQFPLAAPAGLRVRCVNLRQPEFAEVELPGA